MSDAIGTSNIWPLYAKGNTSEASRKTDNTLGKDDFLKILLAQLSNQDPIKPLEDKEFIAQMAQFSSIEQIMNMSKEMKMLRQSMGVSAGLIGKAVSWVETNMVTGESTLKSGIVDALTYKDGNQYVNVDQAQIPLDEIIQVWNAEEEQQ